MARPGSVAAQLEVLKPAEAESVTHGVPLKPPEATSVNHGAQQTIFRIVGRIGLFLSVAGVYLTLMSRTISGGDAGELAACACSGAVAHPPGYPLFVLLYGSVWSIIDALSLKNGCTAAFVFNTVSAIVSAVAVVVLQTAMTVLSGDFFMSTLGALMFGLSSTVVLYASQAEVFALNNLLVSILILLLIWIFEKPTPSRSYMCAFVSGLAMSNQMTSLFFIVPFAVSVYVSHRRLLSPSVFVLQAVSFVAGLSPYAYLPYASSQNRKLSWGDQLTIEGFLKHVLRQEYGTFQLQVDTNTSTEGGMYRLWLYIRYVGSESLYVGAGMALFGCYTILCKRDNKTRHRRTTLTLLCALVFYMGVFSSLSRISLTPLNQGVQERFWPQPHQVICTMSSIGLAKISESFPSTRVLAVAFLSVQIAHTFTHRAMQKAHTVHSFGQAVLSGIPRDGIVLAHGDALYNAVTYLQACEKMRPDVSVLHLLLMQARWFVARQQEAKPRVEFPGAYYHPDSLSGGFSLVDFFQSNQRPIYVCFSASGLDLTSQEYRNESIQLKGIRQGYCRRLLSHESNTDWQNSTGVLRNEWKQLSQLPPYNKDVFLEDTWEFFMHVNTWFLQEELFFRVCKALDVSPSNRDLLRLATQISDHIFSEFDSVEGRIKMSTEFFRISGVVYERCGESRRRSMKRSHRLWMRELSSTSQERQRIREITP